MMTMMMMMKKKKKTSGSLGEIRGICKDREHTAQNMPHADHWLSQAFDR